MRSETKSPASPAAQDNPARAFRIAKSAGPRMAKSRKDRAEKPALDARLASKTSKETTRVENPDGAVQERVREVSEFNAHLKADLGSLRKIIELVADKFAAGWQRAIEIAARIAHGARAIIVAVVRGDKGEGGDD